MEWRLPCSRPRPVLGRPFVRVQNGQAHRTSRVDFNEKDIIFPIRTAIDIAEQRAERCKNLHDVVKGNTAPDAGEPSGEAEEVGAAPETLEAEPPGDKPADPTNLAIPDYPTDVRGKGEIVDGTPIRRYATSTRPPGIASGAWRRKTPEAKRLAIEEYLES